MWLGLGGKKGRVRTRKRKSERYTSDLLSCPFGSVVNVSGSGLRLRCEGKPTFRVGQVLPLTLHSPQSRLTLRSRVVWVKKKGLRAKSHEVGFEFVDMHPKLAAALRSLAEFGFVPRTEGVHMPPPAPRSKEPLPDYYEILSIGMDATAEQVHEAYRVLARQFHPDANKSSDAAVRFDAISKAYRVLRDPELREGYDLKRMAAT